MAGMFRACNQERLESWEMNFVPSIGLDWAILPTGPVLILVALHVNFVEVSLDLHV